jgi:NitT/TauT family transport system permease protein
MRNVGSVPTATSSVGAISLPTQPGKALARKASALRWGTVVVFIVAWELFCQGPLRDNDFLAPPSKVVSGGIPSIFQPDTLAALWQTTSRFLEAFVIVAIVGTILGLMLGRLHRQIFHGARDVVTILYALPMVPFFPLFVLWLGLGTPSEVAFGVIHGIMPVILMVMTASARIDSNLVISGQTMGASRIQRLFVIVMPAVVPDIIGALKIGAALSLLGVLLAELMISIDGVGQFISNQVTNHQAARLDAMVIVVCVAVVVINSLLQFLERRASHWRN